MKVHYSKPKRLDIIGERCPLQTVLLIAADMDNNASTIIPA
jgi:TusA-related sulfurtransferase